MNSSIWDVGFLGFLGNGSYVERSLGVGRLRFVLERMREFGEVN